MAGFEIRNWEAQTESMIDWLQSNPDLQDSIWAPGGPATDLVVGSLERGHLEAVGLLMEEYDVRAAQAINWAIPEAVFWAFGFEQLPAQSSIGAVTFTSVVQPLVDIPIPIGTQVMTRSGIKYQTTASSVVAAGTWSSAQVPVAAVDPGPSGNVEAGSISTVLYPISGIDSVSNPFQLSGGTEIEGDTARRVRFRKWIATLVRGTAESLEFAAKSTGVVVAALAVDPATLDPVPTGVPYAGLAWLLVDDGLGTGTLNAGVYSAVRKAVYGWTDETSGIRIPGWKAAGIRVDILPVTPIFVKVRAAVVVSPAGVGRWTQIQENLTSMVTRFFAEIPIGGKVSYQNLVVALSAVDPEIQEVNLVMWKGDVVPAYTDPISAEDVSPVDPTAVFGVGNRAYPKLGAVTEPGGAVVTYPEWILE